MVFSNPWDVTSASEFLKFCCPECNHQSVELCDFAEHATRNHELSKKLFTSENIDENEVNGDNNEPETAITKIEDYDDPNELGETIDMDYKVQNGSNSHGSIKDDLKVKGVNLFTDMPYNQEGWWVCEQCPNTSFLFDFELLEHCERVHHQEALQSGLALKTIEIIFQRNEMLAHSGWVCLYCEDRPNHSSKLALLEHWHKSHRVKTDMHEVCQYCREFFVGKNYEVCNLFLQEILITFELNV